VGLAHQDIEGIELDFVAFCQRSQLPTIEQFDRLFFKSRD
jgi:hypothetical protein